MTGEWTMPEWMEPHRETINGTGGNSIEDLMNDSTTTLFANAPRYIIIAEVRAQVALLARLRTALTSYEYLLDTLKWECHECGASGAVDLSHSCEHCRVGDAIAKAEAES